MAQRSVLSPGGEDNVVMPQVTHRTLGWNLVQSSFALVFFVVFLATATTGGPAGGAIFGIGAAASLAIAVRVLRSGVVVTPAGVSVRGLVRTHQLTWRQIASVSAGDRGNITGAGRCVLIGLTDGRIIRARGCASYSVEKVTQIAREISDSRPDSNDAR